MDPYSSIGKTCLEENIIELSSEKTEGHEDWNSPKYQDTTNSGGKKETKAIIFHKMETEEISDRFVAPCFINGLEAYDSEINLGKEEDMISNEFAVKLCLDYEFVINPEEDEVETGVVLGRSFMRLTKGIADFENEVITIYPELDPFLDRSGETEKIDDDWDLLLDDLDFGDIPEIERVEILPFVCKIRKNSRNKRKRFSILEEERPVIKTMAYSDKYKNILDEICIDKMKLDGEMKKDEEEATIKVKEEALIEKEDPRAFVIPIRLEAKINLNALADTGSDINVMSYRVYKELGREELKNVNKGITMLNHSKAEPMGLLKDVLCQVGVTTIIAKFLILDMPIERDTPILVGRGFLYTCGGILNIIERITSTFNEICHRTFRAAKTSLNTEESDSDDEEDYGIQKNSFGALMYGPKLAKYLNCHDSLDRSIALRKVLNPLRKIRVWKKGVSFLGYLPITLHHEIGNHNIRRIITIGAHDAKAGSSRSKHFRQYETVEEAMLPRVHHPFLHWEGCNQVAKSRYNTRLTQLLPRLIYSPCVVDWNVLNYMGCGEVIDEMLTIKLSVAGIDEEIFTSEVCTRAFNIDEPIYNKLCHEFYSTYEFDEVCADDELRTKKIIKFKIYERAFIFDVYFQGGLHSDEHFNAQEYWLSISQEENLSLSRSHDSTIHKPVLRVLHKMITYGLCQRTTGYDKMQKNDLWLLSMFEARHQNGYANVAWLIADEEERSWLIPKVLEPGVPRVAIPRPPRASTQDLYERMGSMEIPQGAIERMSYRQYWNVLNQMGYGEAIDEMLIIKLSVVGTDEEIFTSEA
ncbi:retrotransposon ORF1 [Tanacetum coccineum]